MIQTTLIGLFFGTIGSTLGGIIGIFTKRNSNKFLSFILSLVSGLMLAVICFSLIPEAIKIIDIISVLIGLISGIVCMYFCESIINNKYSTKEINNNSVKRVLKTGIMVSIGIALHNIPEGIAIGSGYSESITLGLSIAIAICIHDIPEGLSMAIPLKYGGMNKCKIMTFIILSGIATGIGTLIGALVGSISEDIIAICLSFASGTMLYIVSGELIPEYNRLYQGKWSTVGNMTGFLIGLLASIIG